MATPRTEPNSQARPRRVAIINFSGNVGKSTLAAHMLAPRIPGAKLLFVETLNDDSRSEGVDGEQMRAREFKALIDEVAQAEAAVVDVGASNVEQFMAGFRGMHGSHEEFDCYVVPTVASRKQLVDTVATVQALHDLGVPADQVRLVFNRVDIDDDVEDRFAPLLAASVRSGKCRGDTAAVVRANEVFELLKGRGRSLAQVCDDETDWRERARASTDREERLRLIGHHTLRMMARTAQRNLDDAFEALFL